MTKYVLITPAKNEASKIGKTIESIIAQTIIPSEWVIVSDGSTDGTDEIVTNFSKKHSFIKFIRNESPAEKDFSSKVNAFNKGFSSLQTKNYFYIGNLDADISFESFYFEKIIQKMEENPKLGIAGGLVHEVYNGVVKAMATSLNSVAGAVQLFRRECFEKIGGYIPIKMGGIDSAAEICARAKGWDVITFPELKVMHQGRVLTGKSNPQKAMFQMGLSHYMLGYHPVFHLASCLSRMFHRPFITGGTYFLLGYISGAILKREKVLPPDVVKFLRQEQIHRLTTFFH